MNTDSPQYPSQLVLWATIEASSAYGFNKSMMYVVVYDVDREYTSRYQSITVISTCNDV